MSDEVVRGMYLDCTQLKRGIRGQSAFTLVEVLVAVAVLAILMTSLYAAFSAGFVVVQSARENLRATQIMVQKLESIRLFTWSQIGDTNNYLKPTFSEVYDPLSGASGAKYAGTVTASEPAVGEFPEAYRTNVCVITVALSWTNTYSGGKKIVRQREMKTLVARNGMQNYIWGSL